MTEKFIQMVETEGEKGEESGEYVRVQEAREMLGILNMIEWNRVRSSLDRSSNGKFVFYSVESINRAIEKRRTPVPALDESGCKHHWVIATPKGESSHGECISCGEVRDDFRNY